MHSYAHLPSGTLTRARGLRRNATDAENALWRALRESLPESKFRRQVPFGPYFVDFLSFPAKLIVEVDGGQHAEAGGHDAARTRYLEAQGFRVLRFWNHDVLGNLDNVVAVIASSVPPASPRSSPSPSHAGAWVPPSPGGRGVFSE